MSEPSVVWDYPDCGDEPLLWPAGMPIPRAGDPVYGPDEEVFRVSRVAFRPYKRSVYIVCERWLPTEATT